MRPARAYRTGPDRKDRRPHREKAQGLAAATAEATEEDDGSGAGRHHDVTFAVRLVAAETVGQGRLRVREASPSTKESKLTIEYALFPHPLQERIHGHGVWQQLAVLHDGRNLKGAYIHIEHIQQIALGGREQNVAHLDALAVLLRLDLRLQ